MTSTIKLHKHPLIWFMDASHSVYYNVDDLIFSKTEYIVSWKTSFHQYRASFIRVYIRVNNPSLNKNIGKYHLPHIWDEVLHNISELKLD